MSHQHLAAPYFQDSSWNDPVMILLKWGASWLTAVILATWEAEIRRITIRGQLGQTVHKIPSPEIIRAKWTGGAAQVVDCLLCKSQVLSSNFSPTEKKTVFVRLTYHRVNHPEVNYSVAVNSFTILCNNLYLVPKHFHQSELKSHTH
jgi:hypothetical protein